ncbi:MAG TPA: HNH endonuclease, partial [Mycobacterium sp.]|nr:HNH endonuclease [Mycobacterium sp.]
NQARRKEIDLRKWRNHTRRMLILFKGNGPSTSPWCTWVNDPFEPEELPPDWAPPPRSPQELDDEPPF